MTHFLFILFIALSVSFNAVAQQNIEPDEIVTEGKRIYRSERASWLGTDIFLKKYQDQRQNIGGYFSYPEGDVTHCLFFTKGDEPSIIAIVSFDSTFEVSNAKTDDAREDFNARETDLYTIRKLALERISKDTMFKTYEAMNLNLVPMSEGDKKHVYVLTGPQRPGVIVFGNDYLLEFDSKNALKSVKPLHKTSCRLNMGKWRKTVSVLLQECIVICLKQVIISHQQISLR